MKIPSLGDTAILVLHEEAYPHMRINIPLPEEAFTLTLPDEMQVEDREAKSKVEYSILTRVPLKIAEGAMGPRLIIQVGINDKTWPFLLSTSSRESLVLDKRWASDYELEGPKDDLADTRDTLMLKKIRLGNFLFPTPIEARLQDLRPLIEASGTPWVGYSRFRITSPFSFHD
jgi:hypothetical protein